MFTQGLTTAAKSYGEQWGLCSQMERSIIHKAIEPTDWVNDALVIMEQPKTDKLRICPDPHDLDKAI